MDVNDTDWFYEDVAYTFCRGILKGMDETHFQPQTAVTRGMVATVLHRLEECPEAPEADFVDVNPARYYGAAVAWAQAKGLVKGYGDGTFRPNRSHYPPGAGYHTVPLCRLPGRRCERKSQPGGL